VMQLTLGRACLLGWNERNLWSYFTIVQACELPEIILGAAPVPSPGSQNLDMAISNWPPLTVCVKTQLP